MQVMVGWLGTQQRFPHTRLFRAPFHGFFPLSILLFNTSALKKNALTLIFQMKIHIIIIIILL